MKLWKCICKIHEFTNFSLSSPFYSISETLVEHSFLLKQSTANFLLKLSISFSIPRLMNLKLINLITNSLFNNLSNHPLKCTDLMTDIMTTTLKSQSLTFFPPRKKTLTQRPCHSTQNQTVQVIHI